jgi:hypothetical protein
MIVSGKCSIMMIEEMKNGMVVNIRMGKMRKKSSMMEKKEWKKMVLLNKNGKRLLKILMK